METLWTSDQHFWHRRIGTLCERPWATVEEMNDALVERWNAVVTPEKRVVVVGDFSLSLAALELVPRLNGHLELAAGNHDQCWTGHPTRSQRAERMVDRYLEAGFEKVHSSGIIYGERIAGIEVVVSHLPYHGDSHHDDRYQSQRPVDEGLPLICGHVHTNWVRLYGGDGRVHRRQINVGVDVWDFEPVPESALEPLLREMV